MSKKLARNPNKMLAVFVLASLIFFELDPTIIRLAYILVSILVPLFLAINLHYSLGFNS